MLNGYERASKEIVPAARIAMARSLRERYNFSESRIAEILGVVQAAVSKYLNGKYSASVRRTYSNIDQSNVDAYIGKVAQGDKQKLKEYVCSACGTLNKFDCKFSALNKSTN